MNAARTRTDRAPARTRRPGPAPAAPPAARFPVGLAASPGYAVLPQSRAGAVLALFTGAPLADGPGHGRPRNRTVRPAGHPAGHPRRVLGAATRPGASSPLTHLMKEIAS